MGAAGYNSYVICMSPRSGSTLLCKLLAATGVAGNPESYFHGQSISNWLQYLGLEQAPSMPERDLLEIIFRTAVAKGTRETGVFGLRLQRHSFEFFIEKLRVLFPSHSDDVARFQAAFGRTYFVYLTRRDKVAQAISYVKAQQTGLWHAAPDGTELERLSPPQEAVYNAREIRTRYEEITAHDIGWEHWFASTGIDPLRITYEELSVAPMRTLREILDCLGLKREAAHGVEPAVAKLANDTNQNWAARFSLE